MSKKKFLHKHITKDLLLAAAILMLLALSGLILNPRPIINPTHNFSFGETIQDSVLNERQYGEIRYEEYLELIQKTKKKNPAIKIDTLTHEGFIRIYLAETENSSKSSFNLPFFNKMTSAPYPDMGKFKQFLEEELQMKLGYDPALYGFELKVSEKGSTRAIKIPYQMLVGLLNQEKELSKR